MDLSIIIPSYNTKQLLDRCLDSIIGSLVNTHISYEVFVVDNNSTDGTVEMIQKKYKTVKLIASRENLGYSRSNNLAIHKTKGNYVLLLNSDTKIIDKSIEKLYRFAIEHPKAFVGPKLFNEDFSPQASCGPQYTLGILIFFLFLQGDHLGISRYSPNTVKNVDWVSGACIVGLRSDFLDVGLFDEAIFMYMEELEFFYRAKRKGYAVLFYPEAKVVHTGSASSGSRKEPVLNNYRGLTYFYRKHRSIIERQVLKLMLTAKAYAVILFAKLVVNQSLKNTYEEALRVV